MYEYCNALGCNSAIFYWWSKPRSPSALVSYSCIHIITFKLFSGKGKVLAVIAKEKNCSSIWLPPPNGIGRAWFQQIARDWYKLHFFKYNLFLPVSLFRAIEQIQKMQKVSLKNTWSRQNWINLIWKERNKCNITFVPYEYQLVLHAICCILKDIIFFGLFWR